MWYCLLADLVVVLHLLFILLAVLGGLLVLRWRRFVWLHLPVAFWAILIELVGWICPLTPLENHLRQRGGETSYSTGFIEHYIVPIVYPENFTRELQITLGVLVLILNLGIYGLVTYRLRRRRPRRPPEY